MEMCRDRTSAFGSIFVISASKYVSRRIMKIRIDMFIQSDTKQRNDLWFFQW